VPLPQGRCGNFVLHGIRGRPIAKAGVMLSGMVGLERLSLCLVDVGNDAVEIGDRHMVLDLVEHQRVELQRLPLRILFGDVARNADQRRLAVPAAAHDARIDHDAAAVGLFDGQGAVPALAGEHLADFLTLCMDQIYNHAVKFPGMFADSAVPIVIRAPCGGRRGYGPTHSQSLENIFISVPGLTVIFGSHRHKIGQLLINASACWPNPTLFLEHKLLYAEKQDSAGYEEIKAEAGDLGADLFPTLRAGSQDPDITLLSYGGMLPVAEKAARLLEENEELTVEIIAPAMLAPLPRFALLKALLHRPRILVVEEAHHQFGFSAEVLAMLMENGYRGKVARLGTAPVPIASARSLESAQLPDENAIVAAVLDIL
jgi:pyruvate/2-oxoglutarate/acetoin dehydrogenase E1 component